MRRAEKEITDRKEIERILENNTLCRIALSDNDMPYLVPMNYGYENNTLYLHCAPAGKKMDIIKTNNRVCFEVTESSELKRAEKACSFGTRYRSVIGFGSIVSVVQREEKKKALRIIMRQHTGSPSWDFEKEAVDRTVVLKIAIETISGKKST